MRNFLLRLCLAVAIIVVASVIAPLAYAQRGDQDSASAAPQKTKDAQIPASGEVTTQDAKTFSGKIVKENRDVVLQDPVTKVSHKLNNPAKAQPYIGKRAKITGKLDANSNTILMESIEPSS
jgi:hypothetical protein